MKANISRRSLVKSSAIGSLAFASSAFTLPFTRIARAADGMTPAPVEEKAVWSSCTVNCGSRCLRVCMLKMTPFTGLNLTLPATMSTETTRFAPVCAVAQYVAA